MRDLRKSAGRGSGHRQSRRFIVCFTLVVLFMGCYLLLDKQLLLGHDQAYHLLRIESIARNIKDGYFSSRIHNLALNGYGYGSGLFYPDLFLYIPALLRVLGLRMEYAYGIFVILVSLLTALSMYYACRHIAKSRYAGLCAMALYVLCQYRLHNVHTRMAVGEYLAFIFAPLVICGLYNLFYEGFDNPFWLMLGFWGLMYTHTISLAIFGIIAVVAAVCHIHVFVNKPKLLLKVLLAAVVTLLASASAWVPVLEQLLTGGEFQVKYPWTHVRDNAVGFNNIISYKELGIGLALLLTYSLRLFVRRRQPKLRQLQIADHYLVAGAVLMFVSSQFFPWKWKELNETLINALQFPWRLFFPISVFLSLAGALLVNHIFKGRKARSAALFGVVALCSIAAILYQGNIAQSRSSIPNDYFDTDINRTFIYGGAEWLPAGTDQGNAEDRSLFTPYASTERVPEIKVERKGNVTTFQVNWALAKDQTVKVPLLYYKGYTATCTSKDGTVTDLQVVRGDNNFVNVILPARVTGEIKVIYSGTTLMHIADVTTWVMVGLILLWLILRNRKLLARRFRLDNRPVLAENKAQVSADAAEGPLPSQKETPPPEGR